ncbi:MAG: 1,2-phenylacetyl-CoA epoxidase subunit PaaD [Gemmatimonadota bacterium]
MVPTATPGRAQILRWLEQVRDPEVPVLSVVELGVVRDVHVTNESVTVDITPTYSGCPALDVMKEDIIRTLRAHGVASVTVTTRFDETWTTDWLSEASREKLRQYGIAPPEPRTADLVSIGRAAVRCPRCDSSNTKRESQFGSTACKAIYVCQSCREPFDYFKPS